MGMKFIPMAVLHPYVLRLPLPSKLRLWVLT